jgi:hypothetical protein
MLRKAALVVLLLALAASIVSTAYGRQSAAMPTLNGTVGPGYTITLKENGKIVKTLKAGMYKLIVADKAKIHAFSLDGPHGFAKDFTKVPFVGTKTFVLNLVVGAYKYYCPPHEAMMFGRFNVK